MILRPHKWFGTLLFYVTLPGLYVYLRIQERTRVVISVGDEVLMLKGWYGSNRWMLPGGGAHNGEDLTQAALREVREETGITLDPSSLEHLSSGPQWDTFGFRYICHFYHVALPHKPKLNIDNPEISHAEWLGKDQLLANKPATLKVSRRAIATWSAK